VVYHRDGRIEEDAEAGFENPIGEVELLSGIEQPLIIEPDAIKDAPMYHTSASREIAGRCRLPRQALVLKRNTAAIGLARSGIDDQKANDAQIEVPLEVFQRPGHGVSVPQLRIVVEEEKDLASGQGDSGIPSTADAAVVVQNGHAHLGAKRPKKLLCFRVEAVDDHDDFSAVDSLPTNRLNRAPYPLVSGVGDNNEAYTW
jgi:hypothetical protein